MLVLQPRVKRGRFIARTVFRPLIVVETTRFKMFHLETVLGFWTTHIFNVHGWNITLGEEVSHELVTLVGNHQFATSSLPLQVLEVAPYDRAPTLWISQVFSRIRIFLDLVDSAMTESHGLQFLVVDRMELPQIEPVSNGLSGIVDHSQFPGTKLFVEHESITIHDECDFRHASREKMDESTGEVNYSSGSEGLYTIQVT